MNDRIKCWLAADERDAARVRELKAPGAWLMYRVGESGTLQRANGKTDTRGGLMGIIDAPGLASADPDALTQEIFMECGRRSFSGVLFDFAVQPGDGHSLSRLSECLSRRGVEHYAHAALAAAAPGAKLILPSALSGGSFDEMLSSAAARFGAQNLCLEIVRMRHDFQMPALSPEGTQISAGQMDALLSRHGAAAYFSEDMLCKYFTYREESAVHFVLFDDEYSCIAKLRRARDAGFCGAFLLYGEWGGAVSDILAGL